MDFGFKSLFGKGKDEDRRSLNRVNVPEKASILIVDDSRTVIAVLKKMLVTTGYRVYSAMNGEDGVEMAKTYLPDLILMDVILPGINGFQATRILRKETSTQGIPIVIISGNEQATEKYWGMRIGANGFLPKPISRGDLFSVLSEQLSATQVA